ncbi:unnamed protein product [Trifolium pratense]|uniref:Uncharacterized protein n=1 Tax=Trifolium pratense TaxID=57577 RepID=A0ACB0K3V4_TRIPR|nr:unnamed protein product [Trifolium pratense]
MVKPKEGMKRPFKPMKDLNMDKIVGDNIQGAVFGELLDCLLKPTNIKEKISNMLTSFCHGQCFLIMHFFLKYDLFLTILRKGIDIGCFYL